jgi:hypothetical protein
MYDLIHDELLSLFKSNLFEGDDLVYYAPRSLALRRRHEKCDTTSQAICPFMNFWRTTTEFEWTRYSAAVSNRGVIYKWDPTTYVGTRVPIIPITLLYESTVWLEREEHVVAVEKLLLKMKVRSPKITISVDSEDIELPVIIDDTFEQGADIEDRHIKGRMYTLEWRFRVHGWYLITDEDDGADSITGIQSIIKTMYDYDEEIELESETITESE